MFTAVFIAVFFFYIVGAVSRRRHWCAQCGRLHR